MTVRLLALARVQVEALRWVGEGFPRVVEVQLIDADGQVHLLVDKEPVFSPGDIKVPGTLELDCSIVSAAGDRVTITLDHHVTSEDVLAAFVVSRRFVTFES
jgi:hypothetical protein